MEVIEIREKRKNEHIEIACALAGEQGATGLENVHLIHNALPELDLADINLQGFWGAKAYRYPLVINAMTGGTYKSHQINQDLAYLAAKHGLIMAVGSQVVALENPEARESFSVVRKENPGGIIWANISARSEPEKVKQAAEMIDADGIQLHLNVPQELTMFEGDRDFTGILENIGKIISCLDIPVMAKEVGFGLSREAGLSLYRQGIRTFDIGGRGGTNFLAIEDQRQGLFEKESHAWGLPTAVSLAEILALSLPVSVIASGGIRTALDAAKVLAMGADLAGIAGIFLHILQKQGRAGLDHYLETFLYRLRSLVLMTGARNLEQLMEKPVIITKETGEWMQLRGIEPALWAKKEDGIFRRRHKNQIKPGN